MPHKFNLPLTYAPKIEGVRNGTIRQTIRTGRRFAVGDHVSFHGWLGRPYFSKWSFRTEYFRLTQVWDIFIEKGGIRWASPGGYILDGEDGEWDCAWWSDLSALASLDGIRPPTGDALRDVLVGLNGLKPGESVPAQVIRWAPTCTCGHEMVSVSIRAPWVDPCGILHTRYTARWECPECGAHVGGED